MSAYARDGSQTFAVSWVIRNPGQSEGMDTYVAALDRPSMRAAR